MQTVQVWTFPLYFFIAIYATLQFLLCVLLFPEKMADYNSFKDYFYSRRRWIFGLMAILFLADVADTMIKGNAYLHALGVVYFARSVSYVGLSIAALKVKNERFHEAFAIYATAFEILIILKYYMIIA